MFQVFDFLCLFKKWSYKYNEKDVRCGILLIESIFLFLFFMLGFKLNVVLKIKYIQLDFLMKFREIVRGYFYDGRIYY